MILGVILAHGMTASSLAAAIQTREEQYLFIRLSKFAPKAITDTKDLWLKWRMRFSDSPCWMRH